MILRWLRRLLALVLFLLVVTGVFVGVQLHRAVPQPRLEITAPRLAASPVAGVRLPWPPQGQAALSVQGVGAVSAPRPERPVPVGSVAKIMSAYLVLLDPVFVEIVGQRRVTLPLLGAVPNYNALLGANGVFGVKTGSTRPAGGNIVFASRQRVGTRTVTLVGAVFGQHVGESSLTALSAALASARTLLLAAQWSLRYVRLLERGTSAGSVRTAWGPAIPVVTSRAVEVTAFPGAVPAVVLQPAPDRAGKGAGTLLVSFGSQRVGVPLQLAAPVPAAPLSWRLTRGL